MVSCSIFGAAPPGPRCTQIKHGWVFLDPRHQRMLHEVWTAVKEARKAVVTKLKGMGRGARIYWSRVGRCRARCDYGIWVCRCIRASYGTLYRSRSTWYRTAFGQLRNARCPDLFRQVSRFRSNRESICPADFGVRSEINVLMRASGPQPTPETPQEELILRIVSHSSAVRCRSLTGNSVRATWPGGRSCGSRRNHRSARA